GSRRAPWRAAPWTPRRLPRASLQFRPVPFREHSLSSRPAWRRRWAWARVDAATGRARRRAALLRRRARARGPTGTARRLGRLEPFYARSTWRVHYGGAKTRGRG